MSPVRKTWTKENVQKLLASLRNNIPQNHMSSKYHEGLKAVDWNDVAFYPFSPAHCRSKWKKMMREIQKIRTLPELIKIAEADTRKRRGSSTSVKPPCNGFVLFCKENPKPAPADSDGGKRPTYLTMWGDLSSEQKAEYSKRATESWKEYMAKVSPKVNPKVIPKRTTKGRRKFKGEPEMPAYLAYTVFVQEHLKLYEGDKRRDYFREIGKKWTALPEDEKKPYRERAQRNSTKYSKELQDWFEKLSPEVKRNFLRKNPKKNQFLRAKNTQVKDKEDPPRTRQSDSENEDIESSSSDEFEECEELEGDGEGDVFEFF